MERIHALRVAIDTYLSELVHARSPGTLYEPVAHVLKGKGKRLRPLLTLLTADAFGAPRDAAMPGAAAVEVFHNFTLVHDDIMDDSDSRRGETTVHVQWGTPAGILAGDFLLGLSYDLLARLPTASVVPALSCFSKMVVQLCEGQALDAEFEDANDVQVGDYLDMISKKTGALLVTSLQIGGIVGRASDDALSDLGRVGHHLGLAFQIQDDLMDLTADSDAWGKPIGTDLVAGKRTYLLLKSVEMEAKRGETWFRRLMEEKGIDSSRIPEVRDRMKRIGVLDLTRNVILDEYAKALGAVESLESSVSLDGIRLMIERMETRIR
jgi:geranylgeranyl diphosphate synthase type II